MTELYVSHRKVQEGGLEKLVFFCFAVSVVLMPVRVIQLPLNIEPFDLWTAAYFPLAWLFLLTGKERIRTPYAIPMWLIFVSSLVATVLAVDPVAGLTVIVKEAYIYLWFLTTVALLSRFGSARRQRIVSLWMWTALVHALLLIAQFLSPDLLAATTSGLDYNVYRPPGLFRNANGAALFQLMGYVPVALSGFRGPASAGAGVVLFVSIITTGSMSAFAVLALGIAVVFALTPLYAGVRSGVKTAALFLAALCLATVALNATFFRDVQTEERLERLFYGRLERSASGRFILWGQARDLVVSGTPLWGIGPRNFEDAQLGGKSLHNDFLSFVVERGVVGGFGLLLFGLLAVSKPARVLLSRTLEPDETLIPILFVAVWLGIALQSQTHQMFHIRSVWFALAFQEVVVVPLLRGVGRRDASVRIAATAS